MSATTSERAVPACDPLARVDLLEATSLAELTTDAALMTRTDRKYVVPVVALPEVVAALQALDPGLRVLEIDGLRRHRYDSTYLDTPGLEAYWRAARGRRHRFKVRARHYLDSGAAFTEVKTRGTRGSTVKARIPRGGSAAAAVPYGLSAEDDAFVGDELDGAGLAHVDVTALVPTLRTGYTRTTLWLPTSGARVTIDLDLVWSLPGGGGTARVPGLAVVETKSPGARSGVDRRLWSQGHRPVRISKYGTGLALLHPDLPAHRWNRVRARHLEPHLTYSQTQEPA